MVVLIESWLRCCSLGTPHLLRVAGGTIRSAAMNTLPFEGCTNVQTTFSAALSHLFFFLMECVSYMFENKKVCQKIKNLQEFPLRNVFLSVVSRLGYFPPNTSIKHFFMSFSRGALKSSLSKSKVHQSNYLLFLSEIKKIIGRNFPAILHQRNYNKSVF